MEVIEVKRRRVQKQGLFFIGVLHKRTLSPLVETTWNTYSQVVRLIKATKTIILVKNNFNYSRKNSKDTKLKVS